MAMGPSLAQAIPEKVRQDFCEHHGVTGLPELPHRSLCPLPFNRGLLSALAPP